MGGRNEGADDWCTNVDVLFLGDVGKARECGAGVEGGEAELGASGCQGLNDPGTQSVSMTPRSTLKALPGHIVANEAEASDFGVGFHDSTKGTLGILSHGICFVENDNFVWRTWVRPSIRGCRLGSRRLASEVLDLLSDD